MGTAKHILVLRFSALGDIAMSVPVLRNLLHQHPGLQVTMISMPFVAPLFEGIERLHFYAVDVKKEYKGFVGLYQLSKTLKREISFDGVADLHNVLRTKLLRFFLAKPSAVIDKGRKEKQELTRAKNKNLHPLKTGFERYGDVFSTLGYPVSLNIQQGYSELKTDAGLLPVTTPGAVVIGIAPFAKHAAKMYPIGKMEKVVAHLLQNEKMHLLFFGTKAELASVDQWFQNSRVINMASRYSFKDELNIISQLDIMLSMDSANMHLASLYGVPVVSIWGGTHPWLGFYGWGQDPSWALQSNLPCRPSSVFGNKPCPVHGDAGCMQQISAETVANKVFEVLAFKGC